MNFDLSSPSLTLNSKRKKKAPAPKLNRKQQTENLSSARQSGASGLPSDPPSVDGTKPNGDATTTTTPTTTPTNAGGVAEGHVRTEAGQVGTTSAPGQAPGQNTPEDSEEAKKKRAEHRAAQLAAAKRKRAAALGTLGASSQPLPPVETPPVKVLLAQPLSERRLQSGSGKKKRAKTVAEKKGGEAGPGAGAGLGGEKADDETKKASEVPASKKSAAKGKKSSVSAADGQADGKADGETTEEKTATKGKTTAKMNTRAGAKAAAAADKEKGLAKTKRAAKGKAKETAGAKTKATAKGNAKATKGGAKAKAGSSDKSKKGDDGSPSTALTTTTGKQNGDKEAVHSLADLPLDPDGWSLKEIVKWGNARERRLAKENAKLAPKPVQPPMVPLQPAPATTLTPKVRVVDGKIVVDEQSLTVAAQQKEEYTKVVTEESHTINSMSYVNRLSNDRWSVEDTELFFRALSQFGTDFSLMAMLFPGRMRKHLKKKFCKESKQAPDRIDAAMRASAHATLGSYREMIDLLKNSKGIKN